MKHSTVIIIFFLYCTFSRAQDVFIAKGKIEFEKKVNLHKNMDDATEDDNKDWISIMKKSVPQYHISYFDLFFDEHQTLYKPGREATSAQKVPEWFVGPASDNIVYNNLENKQTTAQKNVFESTFLIEDSLRKIQWRITNDTRTIAGFNCRKAVGRIMDSVYVVAFYTDQIVASGGPESFNGLPGMILGIAIPRIHATWFASKLELVNVTVENLTAPKKGKKVTNAQLMQQLQTATKDWGKFGKRNTWNVML